MADASAFGGESALDTSAFGGGLTFGGGAGPEPGNGADVPPSPVPAQSPLAIAPPDSEPTRPPQSYSGSFGSGLTRALGAPSYHAPDPEMSALDQSADMLQQRIKRANEVAANPLLQFFNPEGVQRARDFAPKASEELQKIRTQQAGIMAGKQQAATLGLNPGEAPDEATQADRVEIAKAKALRGDLRTFKGLQAVDPKAAEAIQDQVLEVAGSHLGKAQLAFDSLSGMQNQGQYEAKLKQLRTEGTLTDLEALGLKVPPTHDAFQAVKAQEGQALREARIGIETINQKLQERNTYQPMEKKEAETYTGRITTAYGDQITNGQWARNGAMGVRGLVVNGAADPRDLGKKFTLASPEQRKAISEEAGAAVPKAELEKARAFDRTYELAKPTVDQAKRGDAINTNPNVQQAIAEQLASMLRGGSGGANVGLLSIETSKRGAVQALLDKVVAGYAGGVNTISGKDVRSYMTKLTQGQIREVMDGIKEHNDELLEDRMAPIAKRAGALGLDTTAFGWGKDEAAGVIGSAVEAGRQEQIARMLPNHQAIGGGDGVLQLGAQRPGAGATSAPPGTDPTTQLPGAAPIATPVQQAQQHQPAPPAIPPSSGGGAPPPATAPAPTSGPAPGGGAPPAGPAPTPIMIAGQQVAVPTPPGASPTYVRAAQRIESGKSKDPWTADAYRPNAKKADGTPMPSSTASGAYQMIDSTWIENRPAGVTAARAKDATPAQQSAAFATLTAKNGAALQSAGVPVNDTSLYVAHNLGATGGTKLLTADAGADAREVVGAKAAANNPTFFKGKPTVATVLERYRAEMASDKLQPTGEEPPKGTKPVPGSDGAGETPGFLSRVRNVMDKYFMNGVQGSGPNGTATLEERHAASQAVMDAGVEHAPAIGSTLGAAVGSAVPVAGTIAGGAAGGGAGQSFKDYMQGRPQDAKAIAKEAALGAVFGIMPAGRPVAGAAVRAGGAGAVEAGAAAIEGKEAPDVLEAGLKGGALAAGGEAFGRALGMVGHKVFSMFAPDAQKAVREAAGKYAAAEKALETETPKLPGVGGAAGGPNPKYEAAERAKTEAETVLKDAGLKPEEAAYAHKVSSEGVPKQEAEAARPGAIEKDKIGSGYQQLEAEVAARGTGAPKASPKLADGPIAAVESKQVSAAHEELAERTEMAITAPAANFQEKWVQLKDARSALLTAERDALSSTATGRTKTAEDMRTLADTVRKQQDKIAKYVFGEKDGEAFMQRLKVLDTRYRNLMEVTNGGDLAKAATMKGEAGREAERKFIAFAHDDPQAVAAYRAMRGAKGDLAEATVPWTVAAEGLPLVGKVVKVAKLASIMRQWATERAAGNPVKFADLVKTNGGLAEVNQGVRDTLGSAAQRGAAM